MLPIQAPSAAEHYQAVQPDGPPGTSAVVDVTTVAPAQPVLAALQTASAAGAAPDAQPRNRGRLVQEGDTVILEVNRERYSFVHIKRGGCGCTAKAGTLCQ
jgi:hypothetical protein